MAEAAEKIETAADADDDLNQVDDLSGADDSEFGDLDTSETDDGRDPEHTPLFPKSSTLPDPSEVNDIEYELVDDDDEFDEEDEFEDGDVEFEEEDEAEPAGRKPPAQVESPELLIQRAVQKTKEEFEPQLQQLMDRNRELEKNNVTWAEQALDAQTASIRRDLKQALEDGDTDKQIELQEKLADVKVRQQNLAAHKRRLETAPAEPQPTARQPNSDVAPAGQPQLSQLAQDWMSRNKWFANPQDPRRLYAMGVDRQMAAEGWDQNTPEYFEELDRRLGPVLQHEQRRQRSNGAGKQPKRRRRQRSAVAATVAAEPARPRANGKIKLGLADFQNMRVFGLDPQDPDTLRAYAAEKRATEQQEAAERRRRRA